MSIKPEMSTWRRILQRPFEHAIAGILFTTGILKMSLGGPVTSDLENPLVVIVWSSLSFIAAGFIILGLQYRPSAQMGRALERIGHFVAVGSLVGTLGYALHIGVVTGPTWFTVIDDLLLMFGSMIRFEYLRRESVAAHKAIAILKSEGS